MIPNNDNIHKIEPADEEDLDEELLKKVTGGVSADESGNDPAATDKQTTDDTGSSGPLAKP